MSASVVAHRSAKGRDAEFDDASDLTVIAQTLDLAA
jgi:hypothetical protein